MDPILDQIVGALAGADYIEREASFVGRRPTRNFTHPEHFFDVGVTVMRTGRLYRLTLDADTIPSKEVQRWEGPRCAPATGDTMHVETLYHPSQPDGAGQAVLAYVERARTALQDANMLRRRRK